MSIRLTVSDRLRTLAERYLEDRASDSRPPLRGETVVTQTEGMRRWLSLTAAQTQGVFANVTFVNPNGFFDRCVFPRLGLSEDANIMRQDVMTWRIFDILRGGALRDDPAFRPLVRYIMPAAGEEPDPVKLFRLAAVISDLFDQYMVYREDLIRCWNRGVPWDGLTTSSGRRHEAWQRKLFAEVKRRLRDAADGPAPPLDRVELKDRLTAQLASGQLDTSPLAELGRVSFFGLSVLTAYHRELITRLSPAIDCDFYLLNPTGLTYVDYGESPPRRRTVTGDTPDDLTMFARNYARSGHEFFSLLLDGPGDAYSVRTGFREDFPASLLGHLQRSLVRGDTDKPPSLSADGSLAVASCYTHFREAEVLYDYLMGCFAADDTLAPGDILVLAADIDAYAPYIEAVFDRRRGDGTPVLPYRIADAAYVGGDTPFDVILMLCDLINGAGEAEDILAFTENRFVAAKYGFEDLDLLRETARAAAVAWGLSPDQLNREGVYAQNVYQSWLFALKRIIYGYVMQGETEVMDDRFHDGIPRPVRPLDHVEGAEALDGVRLYALVSALTDFLAAVRVERTLVEWKRYLLEVFDAFIGLSPAEGRYRDVFESMLSEYHDAGITVGFDVVRDHLRRLCGTTPRRGGFYDGGVTVCSLVPMRSIPHRIVALIGMDERSFPGRNSRVGFDLTEDRHQPGDRDAKLSNRYLFLEALLSAEEKLYISYIGRSARNNAAFNPSAAVDDLLSYIAETGRYIDSDVRRTLVKEYPLQGYSEPYRRGELMTYLPENDIHRAAEECQPTTQIHPAGGGVNEELELTLNDPAAFFTDTARWYYQRILHVYYDETAVLLPGTEPFELDGLADWELARRIVEDGPDVPREAPDDTFRQAVIRFAAGLQTRERLLPPGPYGQALCIRRAEETREMAAAYRDARRGLARGTARCIYPIHDRLDTAAAACRVADTVEGDIELVDDQLISYSVSRQAERDLLETYVRHLFLCANGNDHPSRLFHFNGVTVFPPLDTAEALTRLDTLFTTLLEGAGRVFPYTIKSGFQFLSTYDPKAPATVDDIPKTLNQARQYSEYLRNAFPDVTGKAPWTDIQLGDYQRCFTLTANAISELTNDKAGEL